MPDFPKPGIVFKDITTLLREPVLFRRSLDLMTVLCGDLPVDKVVAIESRGFILGGALADRLGAGFVPVRKPGKLPWKSRSASYELEYGTDTLEMHEDARGAGRPRPGGGRRDRDGRHRPGRRGARARRSAPRSAPSRSSSSWAS